MDYKKAYEDALERAKGIYNENPSSSTAKFVCGQIFPEIKESEDERIRKELLEEIEFIIPHDDETDSEGLILPSYRARIDRYKSYLEKQKEQKPESCDCSRDEESYTNGIHHVLMNPEAYGLIKQKPAEWGDAERKKLYSDGFDIARKALAGAFMQYLDEHRPEGKMCLSNGECAQLDNAFKVGDVETIVRYINKYQQPAGWPKASHPHPAKSPLEEGVYYIKDGKPVAEYEDGVETDRLLVVGKYCRFYLSMADLGKANYEDAQNKAASLGEGWRCPDSFEGRTIGKMSKEIREKAAKIGAKHFEDIGWFWINEIFDRWHACIVGFGNGRVGDNRMDSTNDVLALSAFQN